MKLKTVIGVYDDANKLIELLRLQLTEYAGDQFCDSWIPIKSKTRFDVTA